MFIPIPTMDRTGAIRDPYDAINYLMLCFFFTKRSQSTLYGNNNVSLPFIGHEHTGHPDDMSKAIQDELNELYGRHFSEVNIQCTANYIEPGYEIEVDGTVGWIEGERMETISLGYVLSGSDSKFRKVLNKYDDTILINTN